MISSNIAKVRRDGCFFFDRGQLNQRKTKASVVVVPDLYHQGALTILESAG